MQRDKLKIQAALGRFQLVLRNSENDERLAKALHQDHGWKNPNDCGNPLKRKTCRKCSQEQIQQAELITIPVETTEGMLQTNRQRGVCSRKSEAKTGN